MNAKTKQKKRKSASKTGSIMNLLRGAVGERENSRALRLAIETAKQKANQQLLSVISRMGRSSPLFDFVIPAARDKLEYPALQSRVALQSGGLETELRWVLDIVGHQAEVVNKFIRLKGIYCSAVMVGSPADALCALNSIEDECGATLWGIENRISYLAAFEGFESQRAFASRVGEGNRRTFAAFYAAKVSERNEARIIRDGYHRRLIEKIDSWSITKTFAAYIYYRLTGEISDVATIPGILAQEASSSVFDLWETFIAACLYIASDGDGRAHEILRRVLAEVSPALNDWRVRRIRISLGIEPADPMENPAYEQLVRGNYALSLDLATKAIQEDPNNVTTFLTLCRLQTLGYVCEVGEQSLLSKLLTVHSSESSYKDASAIDDIERLSVNFGIFGAAAALEDITKKTSTSLLWDVSPRTQLLSSGEDYTALKAMKSLTRCDDTAIDGLLGAVKQYELKALGFYEDDSLLGEVASAFALIDRAAQASEYEIAKHSVELLINSSYPILAIEGAILKAWLLFASGRRDECIICSVGAVVDRPEVLRSIPIKNLLCDIGYREVSHLDASIELPILFYLYGIVVGDSSKEISLKVSFKQFLKKNALEYPSRIVDKVHHFDEKLKVFFLSNVCTQEVMDLCGTFNSMEKLDAERMEVCKALIALDPGAAETYEDELIELTRRLSIEKAVLQVESSRIYADAQGLERYCRSMFKDLFLRYMDYRKSVAVIDGGSLEKTVDELLRTRDLKKIQSFLENYDVSSEALLLELIEGLADAFLNAPRYGIDSFIGSRIRHGSFEGAFRDPIEVAKLITKIDSKTGDYESNGYWLSAVSDPSACQALDSLLKTFSRNVDAILDEAVSKYLFVQSKEHPHGIVVLWRDLDAKRTLLKSWIIEVKGALGEEATIEQLFYFCLHRFFFPSLEVTLQSSANFIETTVYTRILSELDKLVVQINKQKSFPIGGLLAAISVLRESMSAAKEKVVRWFGLSAKEEASYSFTLQTAIEIGFKSVQNLHSRFHAALEWSVDDAANVILHPQAFQVINDVSYLIFGNVFEHSGYFSRTLYRVDDPVIGVQIFSSESSLIGIKIVSPIARDEDLSTIEANCEAARGKISSSAYEQVVKQKKRTGLVRLASRIEYDGSSSETFKFGLERERFFFVEFLLPRHLLTTEGIS